ncbi:DUF933 domain-containing protein, partial [Klebsiella pneumoniae]|nr:DUF933 domain-containing protein [Klebsiella pneumoniae]
RRDQRRDHHHRGAAAECAQGQEINDGGKSYAEQWHHRVRQDHAAKEKGLVRSEGKEYVMQDGDIVLFKFNV